MIQQKRPLRNVEPSLPRAVSTLASSIRASCYPFIPATMHSLPRPSAEIPSKPLSPPPLQATSPTSTSIILSIQRKLHSYFHRTNGAFMAGYIFMHGMGKWLHIHGLRWIYNKAQSKTRHRIPFNAAEASSFSTWAIRDSSTRFVRDLYWCLHRASILPGGPLVVSRTTAASVSAHGHPGRPLSGLVGSMKQSAHV
ncbi:hypothetical protein BKA70DRAFT_727872 [Coprinopsis sp. MPI-PUGE-AT-0042]|nr:hypothetical protein BKA70DRAFT_727872 [Coprinopsis sp. MPI-PUGE-AT-0042]